MRKALIMAETSLQALHAAARHRNALRHKLDRHVAQVKADLAARSVGGRVADAALAETKVAAQQSLDIARESKGIVAATAGLLALWFLRRPIIGWLDRLLPQSESVPPAQATREPDDDV
mgnify:CR=1 FL=1